MMSVLLIHNVHSSCTYIHNDPLLDNCLNDLLSLSLFSLSPPSIPPSTPVLLCWLAGGVLLSETNTSSDTWLTAGDGRGERAYGTDIHARKEAEQRRGRRPSVVGPLLVSSCVGVSKQFSAPPGLQTETTERDKGVLPTSHCPRDESGLGQCWGLAGLGLGPWGCFFGRMVISQLDLLPSPSSTAVISG